MTYERRERPIKVAVLDGFGKHAEWDLYREWPDGRTEELPWPQDWPKWVDARFMAQQGYHTRRA